jgi:hypothetical protein
VREALPSVSYLDGFPVSQLDVPAEQQVSGRRSGDRRIGDESMSSQKDARSSHELRRSWEPIDDPFAPSLEEMEAFKRRMGIHPDVDPFGRPGTAGRNGKERGTERTLAGRNLDEKMTNPVTDRSSAERGLETGAKDEEGTGNGGKDGTEKETEESGTERRLVEESQAGDGLGSVAARARKRHVLRVEDALADLNERVSYRKVGRNRFPMRLLKLPSRTRQSNRRSFRSCSYWSLSIAMAFCTPNGSIRFHAFQNRL